MGIESIIEISAGILVSLGGASAIILGFSGWLGKVWANKLMQKDINDHARDIESLKSSLSRELESDKIKLQKSSFIFQREYEAVSEFIELKINSCPHIHPGMEDD